MLQTKTQVRPVSGGGGQTEIYEQQYAKWCLQDSHQPNLRSLATH